MVSVMTRAASLVSGCLQEEKKAHTPNNSHE